ncbi:hypothetical protein [Burkholderia ubonensis]|uniref:hypothetical protein n=1 Tax=Burkholderia ubonensis TaxID=101571 RepID=UPI000759CD3A|nr:hypothetical protein [Burkholderia ubonensis]KVA26054.1 hypothetical protein WI43_00080 [Burkholderia ubonensis]
MEQVRIGSDLVAQEGMKMDEIVLNVERVKRIMGEITDATQAQSAGIEQVPASTRHAEFAPWRKSFAHEGS